MRPLMWTTNRGDRVEVYDAGDGPRYRVIARNGEIVEQGSEAYSELSAAADAAARHHPNLEGLTDDQLDVFAIAVKVLADGMRGRPGGEPS